MTESRSCVQLIFLFCLCVESYTHLLLRRETYSNNLFYHHLRLRIINQVERVRDSKSEVNTISSLKISHKSLLLRKFFKQNLLCVKNLTVYLVFIIVICLLFNHFRIALPFMDVNVEVIVETHDILDHVSQCTKCEIDANETLYC